MPKLRTPCERRGTCSHSTRNIVIGVSVVGLLLVMFIAPSLTISPLSTAPGFTLSFNNGAWDMNSKLWGGEVSGVKYYSYQIPAGVDTSALPTQVPLVTGTTLTIDPDRTSKTNLPQGPYITGDGQWAWDRDVPKTNGADPTVQFTISRIWAAMIDGGDAPGGTPVIAKQFNGVTPEGTACIWYTYYWKVSIGVRTNTIYCDQPQVQGNRYLMTYEHNQARVTLYLDTAFQSKVTNSSYWWSFGDASVQAASTGVYPTNEGPPPDYVPGSGNWPWSASIADISALRSQLSVVQGSTSGKNSGNFVLSVSAILTPGVLYSKDWLGNIDGVVRKVDMQATFTLLYSILVTAPLTVPPTPPQPLDWIADFLQVAMSDPTSWQFWILIGAVVLVVYLLIPKKKVGQALQQHFHIGEKKDQRRRSKS